MEAEFLGKWKSVVSVLVDAGDEHLSTLRARDLGGAHADRAYPSLDAESFGNYYRF
jgi:hypothetical protein